MPSFTFNMTNIPVCIPLDLWYHPSHSHHQDFPRLFLTFPGYPGSKKWKKKISNYLEHPILWNDITPNKKKKPRIHNWQPRLAFTTGSHAFGWQFFYRFWVYWLDNLIGKLLSGFQLGNHQVCLKYWKILKGPKYLRNKDFPPFHGWIFGAHFCFWWILGSLEYQRLQRTQSIQTFSTFWYLNQNLHVNFEILKLKYSGILMGGGFKWGGYLIFSMVFSDSLTFPQGSPTNPTGFPVTFSPWTGTPSFKKPILVRLQHLQTFNLRTYEISCTKYIDYSINIDT